MEPQPVNGPPEPPWRKRKTPARALRPRNGAAAAPSEQGAHPTWRHASVAGSLVRGRRALPGPSACRPATARLPPPPRTRSRESRTGRLQHGSWPAALLLNGACPDQLRPRACSEDARAAEPQAAILPGPPSRQSPVALVGFRGGEARSRDQACDKGAEQGSPAPARIGNELEEAEIER